ncbi:MAG: L-serine ammonia-lyase, partial [Hyphomicrobiales bacterium]|nr:L-serine ammonia-lyase [Hyphomicrobiales bacterium]
MIRVGELFKIGIGPSSSHTVGPMKAAAAFVDGLARDGAIDRVASVVVTLFGSLAFTGKGHATDKAVILGLSGERPQSVDPDRAEALVAVVAARCEIVLAARRVVRFDPSSDIHFDYVTAPLRHPNTLAFCARDASGEVVSQEAWLSIGGGFVVREDADVAADGESCAAPYPFRNAAEMLARAGESGLTIAEMVRANEAVAAPDSDAEVDAVVGAMFASLERGLTREGPLPGSLKVNRRAKAIYDRLVANAGRNARAAHEIMDYVSVYAMAVNEENAAGGRVVTAPTNGAAGVIPAVLRYYRDHCAGATAEGLRAIILTATAIGALFKMNASISGAEVGCQGEVGVASSMAAAGLCAALGGSNAQIENAAEIAMEHHLGMTCDPVGGL